MDLSFILAVAEQAAEHAGGAAEHEEKSELPFFIAGGFFAVFAVAISVYGFKRPDFPTTAGAARSVMGVSAILWLTAVGTAVYVAL